MEELKKDVCIEAEKYYEKYKRRMNVKKELTTTQKKLDTDIWIIALVTFAGFLLYMLNGNKLATFIADDNIHILLRTIVVAFWQFSIAGLGSMIVCAIRKETLVEMGIQKKGALKAILVDCKLIN